MASLLHLFAKDPEGILKSVTLRVPNNSAGGPMMGTTGSVPFDLVQNGDYGDFVRVPGSEKVCAWTEYPNGASVTRLSGTAFALTAPLSGCTIGALNNGTWFHRAATAAPKVGGVMIEMSDARVETLNFIFGPEEYDPVSARVCPGGGAQIVVFGMVMPDTKWTFWAQWQRRSTSGDNATRLFSQQVGRYPNA